MKQANADDSPVVPRAPAVRGLRAMKFIAGSAALAGIFTVAFRAWQSESVSPQGWAAIGFALAFAALVLAWFQQYRWRRAVRELAAALTEIRAGALAIESLESHKSRRTTLPPLITQIQELLRDLRQQRAEVATLEAELRQRVAQRTDALERVIGSLRQQATRDALTGLFNRRFLDQYLPQLYDRCLADGSDLAVLMMDVDHFKFLNDTLGHAAGDEMLRMTAQVIRSGARGEDAAFRCGGDEFVVLMPGCGREEALALAGQLSTMVDGLSKSWRLATPPRLSVGIATRRELTDPSPKALLAEADRALYAKKRGRRRDQPGIPRAVAS